MKHRYLAPLALGLIIPASLFAAAQVPARTAAELSRQLQTDGAKAVIAAYGDSFDEAILSHIDKGESSWIALAPQLANGTDAGTSESLTISLAYALPHNPAAVLKVLNQGNDPLAVTQVCGRPFIEASSAQITAYTQSTLKAVAQINTPALQTIKAACIRSLKH